MTGLVVLGWVTIAGMSARPALAQKALVVELDFEERSGVIDLTASGDLDWEFWEWQSHAEPPALLRHTKRQEAAQIIGLLRHFPDSPPWGRRAGSRLFAWSDGATQGREKTGSWPMRDGAAIFGTQGGKCLGIADGGACGMSFKARSAPSPRVLSVFFDCVQNKISVTAKLGRLETKLGGSEVCPKDTNEGILTIRFWSPDELPLELTMTTDDRMPTGYVTFYAATLARTGAEEFDPGALTIERAPTPPADGVVDLTKEGSGGWLHVGSFLQSDRFGGLERNIDVVRPVRKASAPQEVLLGLRQHVVESDRGIHCFEPVWGRRPGTLGFTWSDGFPLGAPDGPNRIGLAIFGSENRGCNSAAVITVEGQAAAETRVMSLYLECDKNDATVTAEMGPYRKSLTDICEAGRPERVDIAYRFAEGAPVSALITSNDAERDGYVTFYAATMARKPTAEMDRPREGLACTLGRNAHRSSLVACAGMALLAFRLRARARRQGKRSGMRAPG